jgi:hypothetical protein
MAFTDEEANGKFTQPFSLEILGEKISWVPGQLTLVVDPTNEKARAICHSLEDFANNSCNYEYEIAVTPVGPFLVNEISNPYTFVWAAYSKYDYTKIVVEGKAPTLKDVGLDGRDYDKKTNPRIY